MYTWGRLPKGAYRDVEVTASYEPAIGEIVYFEVGHSVTLGIGLKFALSGEERDKKVAEFEKRYANKYIYKIIKEGHSPFWVETEAQNVNVVFAGIYSKLTCMMVIRCAWRVEHASPFAISIAVGWAVVVLAAIVAAYLTAPYWGPIFWRLAGYDPGEAPPSPPPPPGLEELMWIVIAIAILIAIVYILPYIAPKKRRRRK